MRAIILAGISQLAISSVAFANNAVTRANEAMGMAMIAACQSPVGNPFHKSRAYAMAHLAIHDALNAIERKYQPYTYDKKAEAGTSPNAAIASAAYHVMAPTTQKIPAEVLPESQVFGKRQGRHRRLLCYGAGSHSRWARERQGNSLGQSNGRGRAGETSERQRRYRRTVHQQDLPAVDSGSRQVSMHAGVPIRGLREMGKRHAFHAERPYGISARSSLQGG